MMRVDHQNESEMKLGYLHWHEKADESTTRGEKQTQCSECGLWFFPWEQRSVHLEKKR